MNRHDRLKTARANAGYGSAKAATDAFGWTYPTYAGHENASRDFGIEDAEKYARAFRVKPEWLVWGIDDGPNNQSTLSTSVAEAMRHRITAIREGMKLDREQFADLIGIAALSYRSQEAGMSEITPETLLSIKEHTGFTTDFLLTGDTSGLSSAKLAEFQGFTKLRNHHHNQ